MNKLLIILLSTVLFLLLTLTGILLFAFSEKGNEMLKPYVQHKLEAEIGMPVEVSSFKLAAGISSVDMRINKQAVVHVVTQYSLWNQSFKGSYHIKTDSFSYEKISLKDADITGRFQGVLGNMDIEGKGTALGEKLEYRLSIIDDVPQKIVAKMKEAQLSALLQLLGYPPLAEGRIDLDINMPDIGEDKASGYGHIVLNEGYFNRALVEELYGYALPEKSYLHGTIDAALEGQSVKMAGEVQSNLFTLQIKDALADLNSDQLRAAYTLDVKEMRILAANKLAGPFKVEGNVERKEDTMVVTGTSRSLGGELHFSAGKRVEFSHDIKTAKVDASELSVEKVLALSGLPMYAKGTADGHIDFTNLDPEEGTFSFKSVNLSLQPDEMKKLAGEAFTANAELESSGRFKGGIGYINTRLKSSLGDAVLDNMVYDTQNKTLKSAYAIDIPNLKALQPLIGSQLYGPLVLKGELSKEQLLNVTGATESLGGKISYTLTGDDLSSTLQSVPLENIFGTLGHKKNFLGSASGEGRYNLKYKSGAVDLDIASFQIKPSSLTSAIGMAIGKDPARVIFSSTKFHADIKGEITDYTLHATGLSSSIDITGGRFNTQNNTNTANFKFVYEKYSVSGKIEGTADNPKVTVDTSALFGNKMDEKLQKKLDKVFDGKAGEFLKGLSF